MVFLKKSWKSSFFSLLFILSLTGCNSLTSLFFYPQKVWISTPSDVDLSYQDVWLTAADNTLLHAWWIGQSEANSDTMVLYLHGNAENISSHSHSIYWLAKAGIPILALDYRGFGASHGTASLPSILQDLEAAAQWMKQNHADKRLVIVAQSIGTALAIHFTAKAQDQYQIQALVLDAPFTRYASVARDALSHHLLGWLVYPFTVFLPQEWDPIKVVDQIQIPILMMHSPEDTVVEYAQGKKIYQAAQRTNPRVCWLDSQGTHIRSFAYPQLRELTLDFILGKYC